MDKKMMTIDLNSKVLLDKAERDGVETMYDRKQNFKAQCGFGLQGNCCRICGMGPCSRKKLCKDGCRWYCSSL